MQSDQTSEECASAWLDESLKFATNADDEQRPHVTLTFAQSRDGKIAGQDKAQLALSGSESMLMTHKLRTLHDGILVGIGTVLNDNPQLNARLLSRPPPMSQLPRPVVLDSNLRIPIDSKLIRNYQAGVGRQPLLLASNDADIDRSKLLEGVGVEVVLVNGGSSGSLRDWTTILRHIHKAGIQRLMVEGGAAVIDSLMQQPRLIDALLVTIAPVTVGPGGFGFTAKLPDSSGSASTTQWSEPSRAKFGKDDVVLWHKQ